MAVTDPCDSVLVPSIGLRSRVIVRQVVPRIAGRTIVFANRSPRALTQIRSPTLPVGFALSCILKSLMFFGFHIFNFLNVSLGPLGLDRIIQEAFEMWGLSM